jgi:hypothetical protein
MQRRTWLVLALAGALAALRAAGPAGAQAGRVPDIKEIMARVNKPGGLYPSLARELKADAPSWDDVQLQARSLTRLAAALHQNPPPKGDRSSWDALTRAYYANAVALDQAAGKHDLAAARAAHAKLGGGACKTCHAAHMNR